MGSTTMRFTCRLPGGSGCRSTQLGLTPRESTPRARPAAPPAGPILGVQPPAHLGDRVEVHQQGGVPLEAVLPRQAGGESILQQPGQAWARWLQVRMSTRAETPDGLHTGSSPTRVAWQLGSSACLCVQSVKPRRGVQHRPSRQGGAVATPGSASSAGPQARNRGEQTRPALGLPRAPGSAAPARIAPSAGSRSSTGPGRAACRASPRPRRRPAPAAAEAGRGSRGS